MTMLSASAYQLEDIHISEEQKSSFDYLHQMMDYHIAQSVYDKEHIRVARNLYEGRRDKEEYRYLEETFGIETPIAIKMTPIIKTRIDVLLGLLLQETFDYKISINDRFTLDQIDAQKKKYIIEQIKQRVQKRLDKAFSNIPQKQGQEGEEKEAIGQDYLDKLNKYVKSKFISKFEIAGQILLTVFEQDNTINLRQKLKQYFLDLLLTGEAYYRVYVPRKGADPVLEICKPENVFFNKNTNYQFLKSGNKPNVNAVVHRKYMKRNEVLAEFGHLLEKSQKDDLFGEYPSGLGNRPVRSGYDLEYGYQRELEGYRSITSQHTYSAVDVIPVYHVEWLANNEIDLNEEDREDLQQVDKINFKGSMDLYNQEKQGQGVPKKKGYRLDRYEGLRIGHDIYVQLGKSRNTPRSINNPGYTTLSYNGVGYNDRHGRPYSMALGLKDLQDSYDIVLFYRDNLIATSGANGSRINVAGIPKVLGTDFMERVLKFLALRKQGIELIDPTEEGAQLFQHYGDFRAAVDGNSIQAINLVLESIEKQADIVSGVNRYMYQAAEQRDAVANVQAGVKTTSLVTKDIFELVFESRKAMLDDLLKISPYAYNKGKRGSYLLGEKTINYELMPEDFVYTDFGIYIVDSDKNRLKLSKLENTLPQLVQAGLLPGDIMIKVIMSDSSREIIEIVEEAMAKQKEENNQIQQSSAKIEELENMVKEFEKKMAMIENEKEQMDKVDREIKQQELALKEKEINNKQKIQSQEIELKKQETASELRKDLQLVQLEREQLHAPPGTVPNAAREPKNDI